MPASLDPIPVGRGPSPDPTCYVCGNPFDESNASVCNNCERPFHLRQREDAEGIDCGEVWINEAYLALEFACNVCLGKRPEPGSAEPPVGSTH